MSSDPRTSMAGKNIEGDRLRESSGWVVDVLQGTPIKWLRIHTLPTRSPDQKGPDRTSYLDAIEHVCRSGLDIVTPIDVGVTDVVGTVPRAGLDGFGYGIYRSPLERRYLGLFRRRSAPRMQEEFFRNTLSSIETSQSMGTFPWNILTHTDRVEIPKQDTYFGLFQMNGRRVRKIPAFDYYLDWLNRRNAKQ